MSADAQNRRAFLKGVVAAAAAGAFGASLFEAAEAMPVVPEAQLSGESSDLVPVFGRPPHRPGGRPMGHRMMSPRRRPPPFRPRRRRRVCRFVRGRRVCGWV